MVEFTTVVGVDANTIDQLRLTVRTWEKNKPEIFQHPMLVFFDEAVIQPSDLLFIGHRDMRLCQWPPSDCTYPTQREKMLAGFVHMPRLVQTPWWLKVDTDAVALEYSQWIDDRWFESAQAFIGNKWGYTKPAEQMAELDAWGDKVTGLKEFPALNLPVKEGAKTCKHEGGRLASWITFFHTEWSKMVAAYCVLGTIPVPSEDGYHFYCAKRRGDPYKLTKFKRFGWTNVSRLSKLKKVVEKVMKEK